MAEIRNFINGRQHLGYSGTFDSKTEFFDQGYTLPNSSLVDIVSALGAAGQAHKKTASIPFSERKTILARASELFVSEKKHIEFIIAALGMPYKHVVQRLQTGIQLFRELPAVCEQRYGVIKDAYMVRIGRGYEFQTTAKGPVSVFLPPNDPVEAFFICAHAVMSGQTAVIKPSKLEPMTSTLLAEVVTQAGYPPGAINVVHWDVSDTKRANLGTYLCEQTPIRVLMGDPESANAILSAEALRTGKNVLYSAGKTASVVYEDADVQLAAKCIATSYDWTVDCVSTKTVLVTRKVKEEFVRALQAEIAARKTGDPRLHETDIGCVSGKTIHILEQILRGQHEFGAQQYHSPYTRISDVQLAPVFCEAASIKFPLFSQEAPYVISMFECSDDNDVLTVLAKLSEQTGKRMGLGVYTGRQSCELRPLAQFAHMLFCNVPTTNLDFSLRHQDTFLSDVFLTPASVSIK